MTEQGRKGLTNVGWVVAGQSANTIVLLAAAVILPRWLGLVDYGRFATVSAVVSVLFIVSTLGFVAAENRFLPPLLRSGDSVAAAALASSIWTARLIGSAAAALVTIAWLSLPATDLGVTLAAVAGLFALFRFVFQATRSLLLPLGDSAAYVLYEVAGSLLFLGTFLLGSHLAGLIGGFLTAAGAYALLFLSTRQRAGTHLPLSHRLFSPDRLASLRRYTTFSFVGSLANSVRFWVPVWMVAAVSGNRQAAFFGLAMQVLAIFIGLSSAAQQALMPVLAELDSTDQVDRLAVWHGWMARYGAAVLVCAAVLWSLVGRDALRIVLGAPFEPAYQPILLVLAAAPFLVGGSANNSLHFVRQRPLVAAINLSAAALLTVGGVAWAVSAGSDLVATRAAGAVLTAAAVFWVSANLSVRLTEKRWLGTAQALLLLLPLILLPAASRWSATLPVRCLAAGGFLATYVITMFRLGALRWREVRYLWSLRGVCGRDPESS